jgi:predicted permease
MLAELWSDLRFRCRALLRAADLDAELDAELRFHLEQETAKEMARGASAAEAERRARLALGSATHIREAHRAARGLGAVERVRQDVRYAWRTLGRSPAFTVGAVASLALGIGANVAIFSALDALLLRPLAVQRPNELVTFEQRLADGTRQYNLSYFDYDRIRVDGRVVVAAAAIAWGEVFDVRATGAEKQVSDRATRVSAVTGEYFQLLGVPIALGRPLAEADDQESSAPVAVLGSAFADRLFGAGGSALGRTIVVNGTIFTVVGVMAPAFTGDWIGWPTDFWIAASKVGALHPESGAGAAKTRFQYKVVGRLRTGVTVRQAQAWSDLFYQQMLQSPPPNTGIARGARFEVRSLATGYAPQRDTFARPILVLMTIAALILLITCANVGNLVLARGASRQRELALRMAIGAGRWRLVQQLVTEAAVIAAAGTIAGLLLALLATHVLGAALATGPAISLANAANPASLQLDLRLDGRLLLFVAAVCLTITAAIGMASAFVTARANLSTVIGAASATERTSGRSLRHPLVVAQIALSLILVTATTLFSRTLLTLERQPLGFDGSHLLLAWTLPGQAHADPREIGALWTNVQERLSGLPGVVSAAVSVEGLLNGSGTGGPLVTIQGGGLADSVRVQSTMTVSPRFFATIGQAIIDGRDFTRADIDSAPNVVIVNATLARLLFRGGRAVGQHLVLRGVPSPFEVIAVVDDAVRAPREPLGPALYYPFGQNLRRLVRGMVPVVRIAGDPLKVAPSLRRALRDVDPSLPVVDIDAVDRQLARVLTQERLLASLSLVFGVLAMVLVCVGVYGLVAYFCARRRREIGVRIALGATAGGVIQLVLRDVLRLVGLGVGLGLIGAALGTHAVRGLLYGLDGASPVYVAGAALVIASVAALAAAIPAIRASRIDPLGALRVD